MPHTVPLSFATLLPAPRGYQCPFILCRARQATEAGSGKREGEAVQPANPGTCLCRAPQKKRDQESGGHWRTESYFSVQE